MAKRSHTIGAQVTIAYVALSIVNISFFSVVVYENQIDLITENARHRAVETNTRLLEQVDKHAAAVKVGKVFKVRNSGDAIKEISAIVKPIVGSFNLLDKNGIVFHPKQGAKLAAEDGRHALRAIADKNFNGRRFFSQIDEEKHIASFFVPVKFPKLGQSVLRYELKLDRISSKLNDLYTLIVVVIIVLALFHTGFAFAMVKLVVSPIRRLHATSVAIREGDLDARSDITSKDEIGELATAYNGMADSIQEKIQALQKRTDEMNFELGLAGEIQNLIYPTPSRGVVSWAAWHRPCADISGDYYDVLPIDDNRCGVLIVDASGHGIPAAMITVMAREQFSIKAENILDPAKLLQSINTEISGMLGSNYAYFTAFYAIIDAESERVSYANAGHVRPLVLRKDGKFDQLSSGGFPVGIDQDMNHLYTTESAALAKGDKLFLYTDGITDVRSSDGTAFGVERLKDALAAAAVSDASHTIDNFKQSFLAFSPEYRLEDDTTIFVAEIR